MKYIRTKDGRIIDATKEKVSLGYIPKQADTIEELCDYWDFYDVINEEYSVKSLSLHGYRIGYMREMLKRNAIKNVKLVIRTDKGLIYVAKMNKKGELELL